MDVLEHEHQRRNLAEGLERLGQLAHHALARRADDFPLKPLAFVRADQPRHLCEPHRSVAAQQLHHTFVLAQLVQHLEPRQVGFAGAVLLDALPARDSRASMRDGPLEEGLDQRRLADSRFAGDEHDAPITTPGFAKASVETRQFPVAAHQPRGQHILVGRIGFGLDGCGDGWAQVSVAPAMHGLDVDRRQRVVVERPPDLPNARCQRRVRDGRIVPDSGQQLVFGHELTGVVHQVAQDGERSGRQLETLPTLADGLVLPIE